MEQLNNLDVFFLVIVGISSLVGVARGFTKELLSLIGWAVAGAAVYFLTPVVTPIMHNYIASETLSKIVSGMLVLLVVCIFWVLAVDKIATSIRQSKLSPLDRIFGLAFGALRGAIVVVLLVMMISSLVPEDFKKGVFAESKIFVASEELIEPIKSLIPQETMDNMHAQMEKLGFGAKKAEEQAETSEENPQQTKDEKAAEEPKKAEDDKKTSEKQDKPKEETTDAENAFMELAQPKIEAAKDIKKAKELVDEMAEDLQKLMDALEEQTIQSDNEDFGL